MMFFLGRHLSLVVVGTLLFFCQGTAWADNDDLKAQAVAKRNACLGCHADNKKIVGPSFQDIAKKYASNPNAKVFLKNKILKGGSGSWGVVPMPANAKINDADLSILALWILRGAPTSH